MRDYIILNGINSKTINGLLISTLPPITKPLIRTSIEEIDGRDGDIVTTLGYSAYNKEFQIGLYGNYDIDEIIEYFNSEGTVVFSNEPDKYYNYQIINQIDFEKLIRFKTATVTMHIQPFKYSLTDNEKSFIIDNNLINLNKTTINSNGISLVYDNGEISISGTGTGSANNPTKIYLPINSLNLLEGTYTLEAETENNITDTCYLALLDNNSEEAESFGGQFLEIKNTSTTNKFSLSATLTSPKIYNCLCFKIPNRIDFEFKLKIKFFNNNNSSNISIRNVGNIYAKPIITLYGTGNIELLLNGISMFLINLGSFTSITIDTTKMEAYSGSLLLNRLVTGDYDNFKLNIGKNIISWNGNITKIEISNFSRWL